MNIESIKKKTLENRGQASDLESVKLYVLEYDPVHRNRKQKLKYTTGVGSKCKTAQQSESSASSPPPTPLQSLKLFSPRKVAGLVVGTLKTKIQN